MIANQTEFDYNCARSCSRFDKKMKQFTGFFTQTCCVHCVRFPMFSSRTRRRQCHASTLLARFFGVCTISQSRSFALIVNGSVVRVFLSATRCFWDWSIVLWLKCCQKWVESWGSHSFQFSSCHAEFDVTDVIRSGIWQFAIKLCWFYVCFCLETFLSMPYNAGQWLSFWNACLKRCYVHLDVHVCTIVCPCTWVYQT